MKTVQLKVEKRDKNAKKPNVLRSEGLIPATVYGPDIEPTNLQLLQVDFRQIPASDYTHIVELTQEGEEPFNTLIKKIQRQPVSGQVQNIEFYKLKKGHKVSIKVALNYIGISEAVKLGADFLAVHQEVNIKCLPRSIPEQIDVDLSLLKEIDDTVTFGQLKLDEGVELMEPPLEIVCKAAAKKVSYEEPTDAPTAEVAAGEGEAAKTEEKKD